MRRFLIFSALFIAAFYSKAQDSLSFSFYLDTYYTYDFSNPNNNQRQYVTQVARHNEFNFNLALLKTSYQNDHLRANLALQAGTYPLINYAEPTVLGQILHEANVGVRIGENSWIDAGIMGGHFGYESALSLNNELYSQAFATEYTPYYQTGVQFSTQFSEEVIFRAVVINGWQNIYETNDAKAAGIALDYLLDENFTFGYGNFFGREPSGTEDALRIHNNVYASYQQDGLSATAVLDLTLQEDGNSYENVLFITLIGEYSLRESLSVSGRYEYVQDETNILIGTQPFQTHILSTSLNYFIRKNIAFRAEGKLYFGNEPIWNVDNGSNYNNQALTTGLTIMIE